MTENVSHTEGPSTPFTRAVGIRYPLICGAMYPCSNPELVAAASKAGGIGIVQPLSIIYANGMDLRAGLRKIRELTDKPYGFNVLTEQSSKIYQERMSKWVDVALEEGCRFFITALGNPRWIVERVKPLGGIVYHDVTERKWALKAIDAEVDGLICVNDRAGGHAGTLSPEKLIETLGPLGKPLICAGGVGDEAQFKKMLSLGYAGVQMGTRFIATEECNAHDDYKQAILKARAKDIVLTERLTGVPVSIIETPYVKKIGTKAGPIARILLKNPKLKHWMRLYYSLKSFRTLKHASLKGQSYQDYWQAGKSVDGIDKIEPVARIVERFGKSWSQA
jgi:nitronate monooxygenase